MTLVAPTLESTQETSNHGRLSCLLVDVGCIALRNAFDRIYPVERLHTLLANCSVQETLQLLRKEKILTPTQWCKLYPAIPSSVSSLNYDLVLLGILLRNFCGLNPPDTGWNSLPPVTDTSLQADIARINYYRNVVYDHASQQSLDYETFITYWRDIRDILVRLAGTRYAAAIDGLKERSLQDPELEKYYYELLKRWMIDEDSIKDRFDAMDSQAEVSIMLHDIKASIVNSEDPDCDVVDETENQSPIDETNSELQVSKEIQEERSQYRNFSASGCSFDNIPMAEPRGTAEEDAIVYRDVADVHATKPSTAGAHTKFNPSGGSKVERHIATRGRGCLHLRTKVSQKTGKTAAPHADRTPRSIPSAERGNSSKDASVAGSFQSGGYFPTTKSTLCDLCQKQGSDICRNCYTILCSECQKYYYADLCAKTKGPHVFIELKEKGERSNKSAAASPQYNDRIENTTDQGATAKPTEDWSCKRCTFLNPPDHTICVICASSRDVTVPTISRVCSHCTFYNKEGTKVCEACYKTLDPTAPETFI